MLEKHTHFRLMDNVVVVAVVQNVGETIGQHVRKFERTSQHSHLSADVNGREK